MGRQPELNNSPVGQLRVDTVEKPVAEAAEATDNASAIASFELRKLEDSRPWRGGGGPSNV